MVAPGAAGRVKSETKKARWAAKARRPHHRFPRPLQRGAGKAPVGARLSLRKDVNEGGSL